MWRTLNIVKPKYAKAAGSSLTDEGRVVKLALHLLIKHSFTNL